MEIRTTLRLRSSLDDIKIINPFSMTITRGATAEILFLFDKYSYLIDETNPALYIEQLTFIFKQGDVITYYDLYKSNGELNKEFDINYDNQYISLLLSPEETSKFELANEHNPMEYEIAIKAKSEEFLPEEQKHIDSVIIERQKPILVVDSLYNKARLFEK